VTRPRRAIAKPTAIALYKSKGYRLLREAVAIDSSNKTVGGGIRRFEFEKILG
jgi:putative acetyltransferase